MKVLLLDTNTTQVVSAVYSQTEILNKEVYLVSRLDDTNANPNILEAPTSSKDVRNAQPSNKISKTSHLKAVCFLRPTEINAGLLVRELAQPRFSEYHLFFTGVVPPSILRLLAENDEMELVRQIQEFYGDYLPINEDLFTLNCRHTLAMTQSAGTSWARDHAPLYTRNKEGLQSILLSLKRQPACVRYDRNSEMARQLATDIQESIASDQIYHFRQVKHHPLLLLILDRASDPITPLLSQWTYQAMVHELLGLNNNRLLLANAPGVSKDLEQVVLNAEQDEFFKQNRHKNFGELGESVKHLLDEYQKQSSSHAKLDSIEDMQQFMEKFPEIKAQSHTVSKHVAIMGELARLVDVCSLLDISQFEQELACTDDHSMHVRELMEKLASPSVKIPDKLRLGLLYALRYEKSGNLDSVKRQMINGGVTTRMVELMDIILRYGGTNARGGSSGDMLGNNNVFSKMSKISDKILTSVQGVANVYSQHNPVLMEVIQNVIRGKLKESSFPFVQRSGMPSKTTSSSGSGGVQGQNSSRPTEIIVFMVGGVTYEEATKINEFNENNPTGIKVVLAGSTIHNSTSFLEELKEL